MQNNMITPDLTPHALKRRFILSELAALESKKEMLIARITEMESTDIENEDFRAQVIALGALMFDLHQLRELERRYREKPA